ncbi:MAG: DUF3046 domain-containing protein [Aeriscardovia sp.]|nr:DUF3046 domain-containing protein [Aeriscardovia sp.]
MRKREFWWFVDEIFRHPYGRSSCRGLRLNLVDDQTPVGQLRSGVEARVVWTGFYEQMGFPFPGVGTGIIWLHHYLHFAKERQFSSSRACY